MIKRYQKAFSIVAGVFQEDFRGFQGVSEWISIVSERVLRTFRGSQGGPGMSLGLQEISGSFSAFQWGFT